MVVDVYTCRDTWSLAGVHWSRLLVRAIASDAHWSRVILSYAFHNSLVCVFCLDDLFLALLYL